MKRIVSVAVPLLRHGTPRVQTYNIHHLVRQCQRIVTNHSPCFRRFYASQHSTSSKSCPSCGSPLDIEEISCGRCHSLSPLPENANYLSLFGFPSRPPFEFDLDLGRLRREYLKMMSKVHPDSVINKSEEQKRIAENVSSTITHAYSTLKKPLSRAAYLLHNLDPPVPIAESSKLSDSELLMTVLEVREAIEEATTHAQVDQIKLDNNTRIKEVEGELIKAFKEGRAEDARDKTIELRYWEGLRKACDDWEPGKRVELVHE